MVAQTVKIINLNNVIRKFEKRARAIDQRTSEAVKETAVLGRKFAQQIVPQATGKTRANIINFQEEKQSWVILSRDGGEIAGESEIKRWNRPSGVPLNVALETGDLRALNWGKRTRPKGGHQFGFMEKTADFIRNNFGKKVRGGVKLAIEGA
tara:strand:+ start:122 stop:577 length:456 start_codon:yes stop_codon:yes gene_type:complete